MDHQRDASCSTDDTTLHYYKEDLLVVLRKYHAGQTTTFFDCATSGNQIRTGGAGDWNVIAGSATCGAGTYWADGRYGIYHADQPTTPVRKSGSTPLVSISNPQARAASQPGEPTVPSSEEYWANWDANVPNAVGDETGLTGYILPAHADARDERISNEPIPEESPEERYAVITALSTVDPVAVTDEDGEAVGYWTTHYVSAADYPAALAAAQELLASRG